MKVHDVEVMYLARHHLDHVHVVRERIDDRGGVQAQGTSACRS
jgi:hypothetical protein